MKNEGEKALSRIAIFVGRRLDEISGNRNQREIAQIAGYSNQNMITMIKQGHTKVAIDRVAALAKGLLVDEGDLMRMALEQFYSPSALKEIEAAFLNLTPAEQRVLSAFRESQKKSNPIASAEVVEKIKAVFA